MPFAHAPSPVRAAAGSGGEREPLLSGAAGASALVLPRAAAADGASCGSGRQQWLAAAGPAAAATAAAAASVGKGAAAPAPASTLASRPTLPSADLDMLLLLEAQDSGILSPWPPAPRPPSPPQRVVLTARRHGGRSPRATAGAPPGGHPQPIKQQLPPLAPGLPRQPQPQRQGAAGGAIALLALVSAPSEEGWGLPSGLWLQQRPAAAESPASAASAAVLPVSPRAPAFQRQGSTASEFLASCAPIGLQAEEAGTTGAGAASCGADGAPAEPTSPASSTAAAGAGHSQASGAGQAAAAAAAAAADGAPAGSPPPVTCHGRAPSYLEWLEQGRPGAPPPWLDPPSHASPASPLTEGEEEGLTGITRSKGASSSGGSGASGGSQTRCSGGGGCTLPFPTAAAVAVPARPASGCGGCRRRKQWPRAGGAQAEGGGDGTGSSGGSDAFRVGAWRLGGAAGLEQGGGLSAGDGDAAGLLPGSGGAARPLLLGAALGVTGEPDEQQASGSFFSPQADKGADPLEGSAPRALFAAEAWPPPYGRLTAPAAAAASTLAVPPPSTGHACGSPSTAAVARAAPAPRACATTRPPRAPGPPRGERLWGAAAGPFAAVAFTGGGGGDDAFDACIPSALLL
jgi:hypothetical protein